MLTQILDTYMEERQLADSEARDNSKFRVSDAGKCRLMRYWKRQGKQSAITWTPETLRAMQLGINIHEFIQRIVTDLPRGIRRAVCERQLEDEHCIGHFDLYLELSDPIEMTDDGGLIETILYEIKTKRSKQWYYFQRNDYQSDRQHEFQIVSYNRMMRDEVGACIIAYINRDTFEIHENDVHLSLWENVSKDWAILIEAWEKQEEPAPNPEKWECKYCMYRNDCEHAKGYYLV
jgi:CRISPR/Cas system-associated exonuclease Cas4 (RecB family)